MKADVDAEKVALKEYEVCLCWDHDQIPSKQYDRNRRLREAFLKGVNYGRNC